MASKSTADISTEMLLAMYRIRMVEEAIADRYPEQEMRCPVHLSIGQESVPVGVTSALRASDLAVSAHRSHAHYLAKGGDLRSMIAELYGKVTGCARGRGGSMHLVDPDAGLVAAVPIVGSAIPIGVGLAWGQSLQSRDTVVVVYLGDGATEEGVFAESLDFALMHRLRVLFVVENNYFSVYTHLRDRQSDLRTIAQVAQGHGLEAFSEDGNDVLGVRELASAAVDRIRTERMPVLLELETYRWLEHCGPSQDDHLNYRDAREVTHWMARDPIARLRGQLLEEKILTPLMLEENLEAIREEIREAFKFAASSPFPGRQELLEDIYA